MYRYECARILIEKNERKIYGGYVTGFLYAILSICSRSNLMLGMYVFAEVGPGPEPARE